MKKNGFTLAEVLITLAIIGVVASLTLPALMVNVQEQQAMTAYKKILNSLNEAGQVSAAINGFDYSTITGAGSSTDRFANRQQTLGSIINDQLKIAPNANNVTLGSLTSCAVLTDGTAICLGNMGNVDERQVGREKLADAHTIWVDTNGTKGPNRQSSCDTEGCKKSSGKHLYDQYPVTLYGGNAYPGIWNHIKSLDDGTANGDINRAATYAAGAANNFASTASYT